MDFCAQGLFIPPEAWGHDAEKAEIIGAGGAGVEGDDSAKAGADEGGFHRIFGGVVVCVDERFEFFDKEIGVEVGFAARFLVAHFGPGWEELIGAIYTHVVDCDEDHRGDQSGFDEGGGGLIGPPFLVRDKAGGAIKDVLTIVEVGDRVGVLAFGIVFGW